MKKCILTSAIVLFIGHSAFAQGGAYSKKWYTDEYNADTGYSQNLSYEVRGRYTRPVTMGKLNEAKLISDFIPGYPINWITDYVSVEILATSNGKTMKAMSANDVLSTEQKKFLTTADLGTGIIIDVKYKSKNIVTSNIENNIMNVSMVVVPEVEAEYIGGQQKLKKYLNENIINKFSEANRKQLQQTIAKVIFTVNEDGEIVNVKIISTTGDSKTDKLLVEAINKMPKWSPAENSKGIKVKQEFEFIIRNSGC